MGFVDGPADHGLGERSLTDLVVTEVATYDAGGVSLYDVESEQVIGEPLYGHGTGTRDVAFSSDGRYLVTIADDGVVGSVGRTTAAGRARP